MDVNVLEGCIVCAACESICPEVFEVTTVTSEVDKTRIAGNEQACRDAADACPVNVIQITE